MKLRLAALVALGEFALFVGGYLVYWITQRPGDRDFGPQYAAAWVGVHQGWTHIYDASYLFPVEQASRLDGLGVFQHPPPVAWLAAPLAWLPFDQAALAWTVIDALALLAAALLIARGRRRMDKALILLSVAGFQPVLFALGYATMSPLILLLLVGCWLALEDERWWLAGLLLGLTALKPQLTLLVLPALLAAGYWRTALSAAAVTTALALASVAVIGLGGVRDYLGFLTSPGQLDHVFPWTVKGLVGSGVPSYIATAGVLAGLLLVCWRWRPPPALGLSLGLLASLFVAQHLNFGDFVLWLVPIWWIFIRPGPEWVRPLGALSWLAGWLIVALPLAALAGEAMMVVALAAPLSTPSPRRAQDSGQDFLPL